ncbi:hypothetical protein A2673_01990 [Candidatus Kaiserbacteria bacterium RIFCSPHIGHO2_01_FULL_50_13]|uniref:Uncharacterized protein n=1 Tax=Candidatus Kaiserbacteria bacterium RIFCSPLOWO2_01_FULL_50_24 TaxID=1798507 RepID=A0A1F6ER19_9BACT|nr:MAG: hypothetical protein A2673_01990 [Candidatus Kaiserbacteria bacterium RIFCSPHIGHO2_01_FULL_50_13]OGG76077.1 MAG: hypothetical protein A3A34_00555 [Candidatus Kaiserbacteria bacterium RIFCSPLOWO2_01_FULL_50_24]OGG81705.1 MAG: hypothetical protein A3H74_02855 [Candidatus Kaiserbacteria bacterium RIFCSPLOWO2_02_FULL_51_13]
MAHKKKRSLQAIEDFYYQQGLRGGALRKATQNDKEYLAILQARRRKLTRSAVVKPADKKKYILSTDTDLEILNIIYELEKKKLSEQDKILMNLVRSQLEHDWRVPLLALLSQLLKKYKK